MQGIPTFLHVLITLRQNVFEQISQPHAHDFACPTHLRMMHCERISQPFKKSSFRA